jgi:hypothetical protein
VRNEARFEDSVGIFPEFIDGYNILILPTTGRYFQVSLHFLSNCFENFLVWSLLARRLVVATTTKPNLGHLASASEVAGRHTIPF